MKRSPSPNHPSPSTSSSSTSCVLDDHTPGDQPLKQSTRTKRARKKANPEQCDEKSKPFTSICDSSNTKNSNSNGRSSIYRGVTRHRWTGRFEAHLWDKSSYNTIQNKKGKQVYLGAYDCEDDAARTYDLAALKYWGPDTVLNFPKENYTKELEEMQNVSKEEYLASLRRQSSGFSRGVSKYRGVAKHHHNGRWEARIGRVFGNKYLYLGTFSSQEEAAKAYDLAAIQYRGRNAVTNFDISNYIPKDELQQQDATTSTNHIPKDELQQQENATTSTETKSVVRQPDQEQKPEQENEHEKPPSLEASTQSLEEPKLDNAFIHSPKLVIDELACETFSHSPMLVMDEPGCNHEHENDPWNFCLDVGGYDPLVVPSIIHNEEDPNMLDLLDQMEFEDDIHLIFDDEGEEYLHGVNNGGCQIKEEKMEKSSFNSSSPSYSSTITSDLS